jgi:hypothetical protein
LGLAPQRGRHDLINQIHGLGHIDGESVIAGQAGRNGRLSQP